MLEAGQNWELFGYDMRNLGRHWIDAWRDLLWGHDSPIRRHLDDAVCLRSQDGLACYQAGMPTDTESTEYSAILLPEALVLSKTLDLPAVVEGQLTAVLALEVSANSPFSAEDTGYGWRVIRRDETQIRVLLVILSKSSTMSYLGRQFDEHDPRRQEVWVKVGSEMVVVQGFGENLRERSYRKRLIRVAVMLAAAALLIFSIVGAAAGLKAMELQRVQDMQVTAERESAEASRLRSSLGLANEMITAVNKIVAMYPNPHLEIGRLTHVLGDGEFVDQFSMKGLDIELRGQAANAASVMQHLTNQPEYAEVTAPRAFTRVKDAQAEQFYLNIRRKEMTLP
jgi:general secretion pathway protein L